MSPVPALLPEEYSSLVKIGTGHRLSAAPVPAAHLLKLIGLRYIEAVDGHHRATATGMFRIATGSYAR